MTDENESNDALIFGIALIFFIGVIAGGWLVNQQPDNTQKIEFEHQYTFERPGDKLTVQANKTHKVLQGCFSERMPSEYYRTKFDSDKAKLTVLKIRDGGQEAFFGSTFEECIVSNEETWHPSYDTQNMTLRNNETLRYKLRMQDGEWLVTNWWREE